MAKRIKRTKTTAHAPRVVQPAPKSSGGMVPVIGWVLAVGAGVLLALAAVSKNKRIAEIKATHKVKLAAMQTDLESQQAVMSKTKKELATAINKEHEVQKDVILARKQADAQVNKLNKEISKLGQQQNQLVTAVGAKTEDAGLTGEGLRELSKMARDLEREKRKLKNTYSKRFRALKKELEEKVRRPEPEPARQFYMRYRHTPWGPAAGFAAAEKMLEKNMNSNALRLYKDLVRRYPNCSYARDAKSRISSLESGGSKRKRRKADDEDGEDDGDAGGHMAGHIDLVPYKPLRFSR